MSYFNTTDLEDPLTKEKEIKKEKNRISAAKCRQKKLELIETLEEKLDKCQEENRQLKIYIEKIEHKNEVLQCLLEQCGMKVPEKLKTDGLKPVYETDTGASFSSSSSALKDNQEKSYTNNQDGILLPTKLSVKQPKRGRGRQKITTIDRQGERKSKNNVNAGTSDAQLPERNEETFDIPTEQLMETCHLEPPRKIRKPIARPQQIDLENGNQEWTIFLASTPISLFQQSSTLTTPVPYLSYYGGFSGMQT
uniref:BZIP domain-containing protein n=1 Tax=Acrobeloides nanus TaxID=290746 RepID=A0A914DFG5_9BILA